MNTVNEKNVENYYRADPWEYKCKKKINAEMDMDKQIYYQRLFKQKKMKRMGISETDKGYRLDNEAFAKYVYRTRVKAVSIEEETSFYNKQTGIYEVVSETFMAKIMKSILDEVRIPRLWSRANQSTYLEAFKLNLHDVKPSRDPNRILVGNGALHLDELPSKGLHILHSFTPNEVFNRGLSINFDPYATCIEFRNYMKDIFNNDKQLEYLVQEIMGYLLFVCEKPIIQKFFVFYGNGANGKSLLCKVIQGLLDHSKNCSATYLEQLQGEFGKQDLYGKMVNISSEFSQTKNIDTQSLKTLCGGDSILYNFKGKAPFTAYNTAKLIVCTNNIIRTTDSSDGYSRRLCVIPFENSYYELKDGEQPVEGRKYMDIHLEEKLLQELPGILNYALEGLCRLMSNNWKMTQSRKSDEYHALFMKYANSIGVFIAQCIECDSEGRSAVKTSLIYDSYVSWCIKQEPPVERENRITFHRDFLNECKKRYPTVRKAERNGYEKYVGIKTK